MQEKISFLNQTLSSLKGRNVVLDMERRKVAFEIEVEGSLLPTGKMPYWLAVNEGSIPNGIEYVSKKPLNLVHTKKSFEVLNQMLSDSKIKWGANCSTHIHVNVRLLEFKNLFNFITLLFIFQRVLTDKERYGNSFCSPVTECAEIFKILKRILEEENFQIKSLSNDYLKYTNINLSAIGSKGSIEFRGFSGSLDTNLQLKRARQILTLKNAAQKDFKNPIDILNTVSRLGMDVFLKKYLRLDVEITEEIISLAWDALINSQVFIFSHQWK